MIYHGSSQAGLATITPRRSSHGKAYVYATEHRLIALLFLCRWNDYLLTLGTSTENGRLHLSLVERYENAFEEIYAHQSGYLYTLDDKNFFHDPICWELELVSAHEERPIECIMIQDVWAELKHAEARGEIRLYTYPNRPESIPADDSDLVDKSIELYKTGGDLYNAKYCIQRFPQLEERVLAAFREQYGIDLKTM